MCREHASRRHDKQTVGVASACQQMHPHARSRADKQPQHSPHYQHATLRTTNKQTL
jgi:hypothetical protein